MTSKLNMRWRASHRRIATPICLIAAVIATLGYSVCVLGEEGTGTTNRPAVAAREQLIQLADKTRAIRDVSATISITPDGSPTNLIYKYFCSKDVGSVRIETVLPSGFTMVYFVDKDRRRIYTQIDEDTFVLDPKGNHRLQLIQDICSDMVDPLGSVNADPSREVYCAGSEAIHDRMCSLFIFERQGSGYFTKSWIGLEDGILHKKQIANMTFDFLSVKVNAGLDERFLGANVTTNTTMISQAELNTILLRHRKK